MSGDIDDLIHGSPLAVVGRFVTVPEDELDLLRANAERWQWAAANPDKAARLLNDFDMDGGEDTDALNQAVSLEVAAIAEGKPHG